jgi:hypothetical protein
LLRSNIPEIKLTNSGETFIINIKVIRQRLAKIGRNKSVGPDGVAGEFLKIGGEAMIPYLARLLEISFNNSTTPRDWKIATVVPIYKRVYRSAHSNYRPISLTSVVYKQLEHVIAGYVRQVWDKNDWIREGQNGFRPGYSCDSQVITVCKDIADFLNEYRSDYNRLFQAFPLSSL